MAIVKENFMTTGLSGIYDKKVVFRQWMGRTVFAKPPRKHSAATPTQISRKELFQHAVDYASVVLTDPALKEAYKKMAPLGSSAYNMAIADFLRPPTVHEIDCGKYSGTPGEVIAVAADDIFKVESVEVKITEPDGTLVENGAAIKVGTGRVWHYTVTQANPAAIGSVITATATDVPGHAHVLSVVR